MQLAGIAAGGIFPVSLAIVGDLVPVAERQIALGRYLAVVISGNFLGGSLAGVVADLIGWRGVFVVIGCCGAAAFVGSRFGFAAQEGPTGTRLQILAIPGLFRSIVSNPRRDKNPLLVVSASDGAQRLWPSSRVTRP